MSEVLNKQEFAKQFFAEMKEAMSDLEAVQNAVAILDGYDDSTKVASVYDRNPFTACIIKDRMGYRVACDFKLNYECYDSTKGEYAVLIQFENREHENHYDNIVRADEDFFNRDLVDIVYGQVMKLIKENTAIKIELEYQLSYQLRGAETLWDNKDNYGGNHRYDCFEETDKAKQEGLAQDTLIFKLANEDK